MTDTGSTEVGGGLKEPAVPPNDRGAGLLKATPDAPKVLCVDDEPDVLRGLKRILGTEFRIVTADDPIAALSLLEQDHDFSVVIADVRMPRMDGGEFLTRAKSLSPMTTRLALTGCVEWDPADTHPSDIFERLTKPCPVDRLHASVMAAAKQHTLLTSLPEPLKRLCTSISATHGGSLDDFDGGILLSLPSGEGPLVHTLGEISAGRRIALRMFDRDVEILPGITVLGRSKMCNIVVNDPRISRRHACFTFNGRELTVEDVSSTNGLLVNGKPVQGVQRLLINDRLTIGPMFVDVCGMSSQNTSFEPTMRLMTGDTGRRGERQGPGMPGALPIVMGVAEKALFLGENRHAERIVRPLLENLLWRCEDGQDGPPRDEVDAAVGFALRLAEASGNGEWVDYVFRLYTALREPLQPVLIERLYSLLRTTTGVSSVLFRHYLSALRTVGDRLSAADQFLVKRIQGLEPLVLAQPPFAQ